MKEFKGRISVIMPAHNEGHHIYENVRETQAVFDEAQCDYEIIVVNDGSGDDTGVKAKRASEGFANVKVVDRDRNSGKGNALRRGFYHATGDVVVLLDADLDLHPKQLHTLFNIMKIEEADVVVGSKRHPDSKLDYPSRRKFVSKIYYFILWTLFGLPLNDTQTGLKLYKHEVLRKVMRRVLCKRYAFDVELLANAHHLGYKIVEAPIVLTYRRTVKWGRITLKDLWHTGLDTMAIWFRMYILKTYDLENKDEIKKKVISQTESKISNEVIEKV